MWWERMSKWKHVCLLVVALMLILLLLCLGGCTQWQKNQSGSDVKVIYSQGGCMMIVDGLQVEQVDEKEKQWIFDENCKISVKTIVE